MVDAEEDIGSRYLFLLQPVKDLAKNWNIDIAAYLLDFIERLKAIQSDERLENKNFNFAEAGLLIQGTAMVYGRKVEYIHQIAMQLLDKLKERGSRKRKADDNCTNDEMAEMDESSETETDIFEPIDFSKLVPSKLQSYILKQPLKVTKLISQIPISLTALTDYEKTNVQLFSRRNKNELIGKKDDFIINTGFVLKNGALMLDLIDERLINNFTTGKMLSDDSTYVVEAKDSDEKSCIKTALMNTQCTKSFMNGGMQDIRNLNEEQYSQVVSQAWPSCSKLAEKENYNKVNTENLSNDQNDFMDIDEDFCNNMDEKEHSADEANFVCSDIKLLDPFEREYYYHAPIKIKYHELPKSRLKRREKKRIALGLPPKETILEYLHHHLYRKPLKIKYIQDVKSFGSLNLPIFIFNKQKKRNTDAFRENKTIVPGYEFRGNELQDPLSDDEQSIGEQSDYFGNDDYEPELAALNDSRGVEGEKSFAQAINDEDLEQEYCTEVYMKEDLEDLHRPLSAMNYEEMLRYYLHKYWTSAEETSKLCQRVQNWEERINPILEEEEQRREFDIHRYESELLENFDKLGEDKPFYGLLRKEAPSYDISRYFLASLTLSNTGNIELISSLSSNNFTEVSNELHCKVIKLERHHEVFDDSNVSL